jgi:outer membrane protein assembly factor BamB
MLKRIIFFAVIIFSSCSGIKVSKDIIISEGDWIMAGGSPEQTNASAYELSPPLELMWDYNLDGGSGKNSITVSDAVVFVTTMPGEMYSIDISSGGKIGKLNFLGKDAQTAPVILGNDVILSYAGDKKYSLCLYDMKNSLIKWHRYYGDIQGSPVLKGEYIYFGDLLGRFYKVRVRDGAMIWKFESGSVINSSSAVAEESVVFGNSAGKVSCLNLNDGSLKWLFETQGPVYSSPMIYGNNVYIGSEDSFMYCLSLGNGTQVWKTNLNSKIISGSALSGSNVITGCVDGNIYSVNSESGEINWKFASGGAIVSSPVVSGRFIYFTSLDAGLYCISTENGDLLWSYRLENKSRTTPVIWRNYLFTVGDKILYCFRGKQ